MAETDVERRANICSHKRADRTADRLAIENLRSLNAHFDIGRGRDVSAVSNNGFDAVAIDGHRSRNCGANGRPQTCCDLAGERRGFDTAGIHENPTDPAQIRQYINIRIGGHIGTIANPRQCLVAQGVDRN